MLGNALFAIGGMLFAILLIIIYFIRAKQTNIDNKLYKVLLIAVLPVILTEILAVELIYHFPNNEFLGDSVCKIYSLVLITWIMIACAYVITLGSAYKYTNLKDLTKIDEIRAVLIVYFSLLASTAKFLGNKKFLAYPSDALIISSFFPTPFISAFNITFIYIIPFCFAFSEYNLYCYFTLKT